MIGPNTDIRIDEIDTGNEFSFYARISNGWIRFRNSLLNRRGRFSLRVADTVVVGVRGTDFKVSKVDDETIEVSLSKGEIDLFDVGNSLLIPIREGQTKRIRLTPINRAKQIANDACDCRTSGCGYVVTDRFISFLHELKTSTWTGDHKTWSDVGYRIGRCLLMSGVNSDLLQSRIQSVLD